MGDQFPTFIHPYISINPNQESSAHIDIIMAPHGEGLVSNSYTSWNNNNNNKMNSKKMMMMSKPPRLSNEGLQRTISDISFEMSTEMETIEVVKQLTPISEVEDVKCKCCGMSEECTPEYIEKVREKFSGKWICGLCAEAVKEEIEKNGGKKEEALESHMNACVRFNKFGRAYPVLIQAEAMRKMFKKNAAAGMRAKSMSPRDKNNKGGGITRSSSCIPAITRDINEFKITN